MALYNFKAQFVPAILAGDKTHTIRAPRQRDPRPGETLHLYTGLRQKGARLLGRYPCAKVQRIIIEEGCTNYLVFIDGQLLGRDECEQLARRDGFGSFAEMMKFWDGRLPFEGRIIHWRRA